MTTKTVGALCAGFGGLEMALAQVLPVQVAWYAETNADAARILKREHPDAPNHGDITDALWSRYLPVDIMTMGLPCQPVSAPGKGLAAEDPRWLWPDGRRAIEEQRPQEVFLENVHGLVSATWVRGEGVKGEVFRSILEDFRLLRYAVKWLVLGACVVGAPHHRHRLFLRATRVPDGAPVPAAQRVGKATYCGAPRTGGRVLLPTPVARDGDTAKGRGEGSADYWARRAATRTNGIPLGAVAAQLPLAPTPTARDGMGGPGSSGRDGGLNLRTAAVRPEVWGTYAEAVATWEGRFRAAPVPSEPNTRGGRRLSALLPEWMMGLDLGFLTEELGREEAIQRAGNGVMPHAGAAAYRLLSA